MSELLQCPFCGGEAILKDERIKGLLISNIWFVYCDCGHGQRRMYATKEEAIEVWNTRVERTCKNTMLKRAGSDFKKRRKVK